MNGHQQKISSDLRPLARIASPKIESFETIERPTGYQLGNQIHIRALGTIGSLRVEGFGSGVDAAAQIKAVSELYERATMLTTDGGIFQTASSNGWAAHFDQESAVSAAVFELIERETALETWFNFGPYYEVPKQLWPDDVLAWLVQSTALEFNRLQIVLSLGSHGGCVSAILSGQNGACVAGHASGADLESAILSAFSEVLRAAHASLRFESFSEAQRLHLGGSLGTFGPGANAMAYAYGATLPELNFVAATSLEIDRLWLLHLRRATNLRNKVDVATYEVGDRIVASVFCQDVLPMFWGPTPFTMNVPNRFPHFVG